MSIPVRLLPQESLNKQPLTALSPHSAMKVGALVPYKPTNKAQIVMKEIYHLMQWISQGRKEVGCEHLPCLERGKCWNIQ